MARNIVRHNFRDIAGGAVKQNLAGPVIGELGTVLAETDIPELAEPLKNKPHGLSELNDAYKPASFTIDPIQLENAGGVPELGVLQPRQPSIQNPPAASPGKGNPYSDPRSIGNLVSGLPHGPGPTESGPGQLGNATASLGSLTGDVNISRAGAQFESIGQEQYETPRLQQFGNVGATTPFKRVSAARFKQEDATQVKSPGYLGASSTIRGAAAAGYNAVVARHEYKRQVWADKAKEADEEMGKLQVEPSGITAWDASVENMAREWKGELAGLLQNKENLDPTEFVSKKQEILKRSQDFSAASQQLQKVVADYNENLDNISASSDPETLDLLNTLNKGGGTIGVANVNGVPTLSGITNGGQQVSVPIGEIASGRNSFRFNIQNDVQPQLNQITDALGKFKKERETSLGLVSGSLGWDQVAETASGQIDGLLNNNASVRSILADKFGYDYDDVEEMFQGDSDKARDFAKQQLMSEMEQNFLPYALQQTVKQRGDVDAINRQRQAQASSAEALAGKRQGEAAELQKENEVKTYGESIKDKGYEVVYKDGIYYRRKTGDSSTLEQFSTLEELQGSPLKRKTPFKRFTDWMSGK